MIMKRLITTLALFGFMYSSLAQNNSTLSIGSIDRSEGGRIYTIALSNGDSKIIAVRSISPDAQGRIKVSSIKYFNGHESVSLLAREIFTNVDNTKLTFNIENLSSYSLLDRGLNCSGPCIEIRAEAYSSDKVNLNIDIKSVGEKTYMTSVMGIAAKSETITIVQPQRPSRKTFTHRDFTLTATERSNSDGSKTYLNPQVSKGSRTAPLGYHKSNRFISYFCRLFKESYKHMPDYKLDDPSTDNNAFNPVSLNYPKNTMVIYSSNAKNDDILIFKEMTCK
jgi:hypothetical protein